VTSPVPPAELRARVLEAALREPARSREHGARHRALVVGLGFMVLVVIAVAIGPHLGQRPSTYIVALDVPWMLLAIGATWTGFGRGRSMIGRPALAKTAVVALTPIALAATGLVAARMWPQTWQDASGPFEAARCMLVTFALAAGPLAAFAGLRRQSDPINPGLGGAALGTAAGAWGAVALVILCAFARPSHLLIGHVLPVLMIAAAGAFVGSRALAIRARDR
jgi:negative regulator of sigma F NrsF-like protein